MRIDSLVNVSRDPRTFADSDLFPDRTTIGIEIEAEDCINENSTNLWRTVSDGSLRGNSCEFVTRYPIFGEDITKSLYEFEEIKERSEVSSEWSLSERNGIHVHIDILDLELHELQLFFLFYLTLEKVLFKNSGDRFTNIHCLPFSEIEDIKEGISRFNITGNLDHIRTQKYISLNTEPIWAQGTVEIRFHEGSYDRERILNWIRTLLYIKFYSKDNDMSLVEYPQYVSQKGINNFLHEIFPKDIVTSLTYPDIRGDIMEGVRFAQETIHREKIKSFYSSLPKNEESDYLAPFMKYKGIDKKSVKE